MNAWFEFYKDRVGERYASYFMERYEPFLEMVRHNLGDLNAEFGCGIGTVTKVLGIHVKYDLLDNNLAMLELAEDNVKNACGLIQLIAHDIRFPAYAKYDLCYSHGVLEHFGISDVKKIIKHQLKCSNKLIHYVPSYKYEKPSFGDERLMDKAYWEQFGCEVIEFNDGYDYILVWK